MDYLYWKLLHIVSVILFLGNITTGLFWARLAHSTRDLSLISVTFAGIVRSDRFFTVPGVFGILIGGFAAAIDGGFPILATGWILWSIILFSISGIIFGMWVAPLQKQITRYTDPAANPKPDLQGYERMFLKWEIFGIVALITPAAAVVIMVLKPALPAF